MENKVTLISSSLNRYDGDLQEINLADNTIALTNVRCLGHVGTFQYVLFRTSQVIDIKYGQNHIPQDSAIMKIKFRQQHSTANQEMQPSQQSVNDLNQPYTISPDDEANGATNYQHEAATASNMYMNHTNNIYGIVNYEKFCEYRKIVPN